MCGDANDKRLQFKALRTDRTFEELTHRTKLIGRRLEPEKLVPLALLLVEHSAAAVTGQTYNIDGGAAMF